MGVEEWKFSVSTPTLALPLQGGGNCLLEILMPQIHSFPPVSNADARLLILGSMPGKRSLAQQQYYANPHNAFWKILGELTGALPSLPYPARLEILKNSGIALWDVLASCERETSLDAHIKAESANNFAVFFTRHPHITRLCFNGAKAEQSFNKFVLGKQPLPPLEFVRLPSTSPAHAGMSYAEKLRVWRAALYCLPEVTSRR
jgi:hypoxanthine-DNA glycosylase